MQNSVCIDMERNIVSALQEQVLQVSKMKQTFVYKHII